MRLIFLHGINQDGRDPVQIQGEWLEDLERGLAQAGALSAIGITMPFYGDALVEAAKLDPKGIVAQGASENEDRDLALFLTNGLEEQAQAAGITLRQIVEEQEAAEPSGAVVPQGFPMSRRINAIVSLLERISPFHGDVMLKLLGQAHAYLKKPWVREAVDAIVDPALDPSPAVLVTHSLGTVIAFRLLRKRAHVGTPMTVPLLVTVGSPLTLATVQRAIGPAFTNPANVKRWMNLRDPADLITLNRPLEPPLFKGPIENFKEFTNPGADPHAIPGYLSYRPIAKAIAAALDV